MENRNPFKTTKNTDMHMNIIQYLKSFSDETLYYCPNPGNAGDSLIAHATFQLFRKHNIDYKLVNFFDSQKLDPTDKVLVYGGGGNLVNNYHGYYSGRNFVEKYHRLAKKLIILPSTINTHEDLLKELGSNVEIICREKVSYNHVVKYAPKVNVLLMDDLVFNLNVEDTLSEKTITLLESIALKTFYKSIREPRQLVIPSPKRMIRNNILEAKYYIKQLFGNTNTNICNCFRTDADGKKSGINIPDQNLDLSKLFMYGTNNEMIAFFASHRLLNFMNKYNELRTNRLHLAIAGTLLGKTVKFYPNGYYKCEAVYEYSMKNKFPNVQWMGEGK